MIDRYDNKEISALWSDQARFETFLEVELAILKQLEDELHQPDLCELIRQKVQIHPERISEIEEQTRHDVIAFCTSVTEQLPEEQARFFHWGVTSSDILDTSLNLQIKKSLTIILSKFQELLKTLKTLAWKYDQELCLGRSHGIYAEPMLLGAKFLSFYSEFLRRYEDFDQFQKNDLRGQFSGAVGNYTLLSPQKEKKALESLGLKCEPISTQVLPRDRIAKLINIGALCAGAIERVATEIRLLQHSDVSEVFEGFSTGQKGSSTMPHKKNPISSENLTGLARILRSHQDIALSNIVLWHERDISHSSTERMYLPDHFGLLYYALDRLNYTLKNLVFDFEKMQKKIEANPQVLSSYLLHQLILKKNLSRENAYQIIQKSCFQSQSIQELKLHLEKELKEIGEDLSQIDWNIPKEKLINSYQEVLRRFETIV